MARKSYNDAPDIKPSKEGRATPGAPKIDEGQIIEAIKSFKTEADSAMRERKRKSERNVDAYLGRQDFSHKIEGQSREFIPKVPVATEMFSAFIQKGLTQFSDWFQVELGLSSVSPITGVQIKKLIDAYICRLGDGGTKTTELSTRIGDGVKTGCLESLMIFKIFGENQTILRPQVDEKTGELKVKEQQKWRLRVDQIRAADYFPDPTGRGLYEIHRIERDLHELYEKAERGIYDKAQLDLLAKATSASDKDAGKKARSVNQNPSQTPSRRKKVELLEFWGTLLDKNGKILHRNCVCTIADDKYLIRKPEPNPFWHGQSPFVAVPILRVPGSVWHKALMDSATDLNFAANELFNLILDGGLAEVWGIKQLRHEHLEDPRQITNGIRQGMTLAVKSDLPDGQKVLEDVTTGQIPPTALQVYQILDGEFTQASMMNDIKLGSLPPRQVKATEVLQSENSNSTMLESISGLLEKELLAPMLHKVFLTILQNVEDISDDEIVSAIGLRGWMLLHAMTPAERYVLLGQDYKIKVSGISQMIQQSQQFQRLAALLQMAISSPLLMRSFMTRFSPDKIITQAMKMLNLDPTKIEMDEYELQQIPQMMKDMQLIAQLLHPQAASVPAGGANSQVPAMQNNELTPGAVPGATNGPQNGATGLPRSLGAATGSLQ